MPLPFNSSILSFSLLEFSLFCPSCTVFPFPNTPLLEYSANTCRILSVKQFCARLR